MRLLSFSSAECHGALPQVKEGAVHALLQFFDAHRDARTKS
jgi:hypothetical protein